MKTLDELVADFRQEVSKGYGREYPAAVGEIRRVMNTWATDADRMAEIRDILTALSKAQDEAHELERSMTGLTKCANGCEEDVVVIVCDHVAEGRDDEVEIEISDVGIASTPRHDCGDPECSDRALCGDCWGSL